ncbi:phage tail tape measure protein [Sphingomonas sp. 1P06PA]|uniref:phage tail tape measure protein n=1 Tax=Sphingomonas sp. 1P06PA TaxID=554121 RepID=UPI0039A440C1
MVDTIGALRVTLGLDSRAWDDGIGSASAALRQLQDQVRDLGRTIAKVGVGLTVGVTAPLGLVARSATQASGSFEAAMKRVEAAIGSADPAALDKLAASAKELGPSMARGAIEAASGIEMLAKNGLSASQIMGGALSASLKLATAGNAELAPAADLTTDVMQQFGKSAGELPRVVDQVTGAMNASKFGFEDFQQAVGQAGGVAGGLGVNFTDFATAIAATSSSFSSGSDAGTSFKTFLTSLNPTSKEAAALMESLGIKFFDAQGNMKDLAEISGILKSRLGGLNQEAQNDALKTLFGTDAMRTAIELMKRGKDGFVDLRNTIEASSADTQVNKMTEGLEASARRRAAAFETLKIAIGNAGLNQALTAFNNALARVAGGLAQIEPIFLKIGTVVGAVTAAIGPLLAVLGTVGSVVLPLVLARLGPFAIALGLLINPMATVVALMARFVTVALAMRAIALVTGALTAMAAAATSAAGAMALLRGALLLIGGPIGATILGVAAAFHLLHQRANEAEKAVSALKSQTELLNGVLADSSASNSAIQQSVARTSQLYEEAKAAQVAAIARRDMLLKLGAMPGMAAVLTGVTPEQQRQWESQNRATQSSIVNGMFGGAAGLNKMFGTRGGGGAALPKLPSNPKGPGSSSGGARAADPLAGLLEQYLPLRSAIEAANAAEQTFNKALASGRITADEHATAIENIRAQLKGMVDAGQAEPIKVIDTPSLLESGAVMDSLGGTIAEVGGQIDAMNAGWKFSTEAVFDLARTINDDLSRGLEGVMRGFLSWKDVALQVIFSIGNALIKNVLSPLQGANGGGGIGGLIAGAVGSIFGKKTPGLAVGGVIRMNPGIDTNLMSINGRPVARVSRGEMISVVPRNDNGGAGASVNLTINAPGATAETVSMIRRELANAAPQIVQAATRNTMAATSRKRMSS